MKTFLMILVICWFVLGAGSAYDQGYFAPNYPRTCNNIGTAALSVVTGPLYYFDVKLHAFC